MKYVVLNRESGEYGEFDKLSLAIDYIKVRIEEGYADGVNSFSVHEIAKSYSVDFSVTLSLVDEKIK